jgi:hypothetical protein
MGRPPEPRISWAEAQARTGIYDLRVLGEKLGQNSQAAQEKWKTRGISVREYGAKIKELEQEKSRPKLPETDQKALAVVERIEGGLLIREGGTVYLPGDVLLETIRHLGPGQIVAFLRGLRSDSSAKGFEDVAKEAEKIEAEMQREMVTVTTSGPAPPTHEIPDDPTNSKRTG